MKRKFQRNDVGFTLIEVIIVIAIIGIIAAIAIPQFANHINTARETADKANVQTLQSMVDLYHALEGEYPDDLEALEDTYLREPIVSPFKDAVEDSDYNGYNYNSATGKVTSANN